MKTTEKMKDMIKTFEGLCLSVYKDAGNVKTVGYGHTGQAITNMEVGQKITKDQAEIYFNRDLKNAEACVNKYADTYDFTQCQYDALVSFAFNLGTIDQLTKFGTRTIKQISDHFPLYRKCNGVILKGLENRRLKEKEVFDGKNI